MNIDVLVIGCGFAGAVTARKLAEEKNQKVLLLEKRPHIGGNMYESADENGVSVHWYGPHIFHTDNDSVFAFLKRFSDWFPYEHTVLGKIDGQLVPIPFNFTSLEKLFSKEKADLIKNKLTGKFPGVPKVSILDLINDSDPDIREFGHFVFEKVFVHYTAKQWGIPADQVDKSVINRVPVVLSYDGRYFRDKIQYMPTQGFTEIFENLLDHPNIRIELNCDATNRLQLNEETGRVTFDGEIWNAPVVFTGALDELLQYRYGALPYRSLDLVFERLNVTNYQPVSVVNYPNEESFTRITEFKYLTRQKIEDQTTILKEYPLAYDFHAKKGNIPYYPIINGQNLKLYDKYRNALSPFKNIYLCGRLAEYKYYNMDAVIDRALQLSDNITLSK